MANVCTTEVRVKSNSNTIDWLESEIKKISEGVESDQADLNFIDRFGIEGEIISDKIGSKWLQFDPTSVEKIQNEDDLELFFRLETASNPPTTLLENLNKIVREKDLELNPDEFEVNTFGRYWDEAFQPIGVFSIYGENSWVCDEAFLDVDMEEEWYWDTQVEPAFDNLEA